MSNNAAPDGCVCGNARAHYERDFSAKGGDHKLICYAETKMDKKQLLRFIRERSNRRDFYPWYCVQYDPLLQELIASQLIDPAGFQDYGGFQKQDVLRCNLTATALNDLEKSPYDKLREHNIVKIFRDLGALLGLAASVFLAWTKACGN